MSNINCVSIVAALAVLVLGLSAHAEEENPFKKVKVGDWAEYTISTKIAGFSTDSTQKRTVVKKTDSEVTLEIEANGGKASAVIKLNEKYEPEKLMDAEATVKVIAEGNENLSVAGKSMDTKWRTADVISKAQGHEVKTKSKVWVSPDAPLDGVVKLEQGKMSMQLTSFNK